MRKKKSLPMVEEARPTKRARTGAASSIALPGWEALPGGSSKRKSKQFWQRLDSVSTARFTRWLFGIGVAATLYVGHVHATQSTFERLHAIRKENLRLHLERDRLKGELDHATGPTVIYPRAHKLGLEEGLEYGETIVVIQ
jgi:hypothetical protein